MSEQQEHYKADAPTILRTPKGLPDRVATKKYKVWRDEFIKNGCTNSLGATKKAYPTASEGMQRVLSYRNTQKFKEIHAITADFLGLSYENFLKLLIKKASEGNFSDVEKLGERLGYFETKQPGKGTTVAVQVNNQLDDKRNQYEL